MPTGSSLFLFSAAALALIVVPGPAVLYIAAGTAAERLRGRVFAAVQRWVSGTVLVALGAVAARAER